MNCILTLLRLRYARATALALMAIIGAMSCGSPPPVNSRVSPAAQSVSQSPPPGYPPEGETLPVALQAIWKLAGDPTYRLVLSANTFLVPSVGWRGSLVARGEEIDVFDSPSCASDPEFGSVDGQPHPFAVGRNSWKLDASTLHFSPLADDPCSRREVFLNTTYNRV